MKPGATIAKLTAMLGATTGRPNSNGAREKTCAASRRTCGPGFQWVVDRSTSRAKDQKPALTAVRAVTILTSLRDAARAKPLDDDGLALLIQNFLDHMIATTTQEISG